jgi:hypothetical protein
MKTSKFLRLNKRDWINGLAMAVLTVVIGFVITALSDWAESKTWSFHLDFMAMVKAVVINVITYLTKNFITPKQSTLLKLLLNKATQNMDPINYEEAIAAAENIDDLGALTELPEEYYGVWVARYNELGLPEPVPTIDAIRAGSVGTSGPKK